MESMTDKTYNETTGKTTHHQAKKLLFSIANWNKKVEESAEAFRAKGNKKRESNANASYFDW
jgi:hypothetical protein